MHRNALAAAMLAAAIAVAAHQPAAQADESACERRIVAKGFPNKIEAVAGMSAVKLWIEMVRAEHGSDYAMWHNAGSASLRCNLMKDSEYRMCVAMGRPCPMHLAPQDEASAAAVTR